MSTDPAEGQGVAPSPAPADEASPLTSGPIADQAKADAGVFAASMAKGALTGGAGGAAMGAAKAMVKTKTGRKVILAGVASVVLSATGFTASLAGAGSAATAVPVGHEVQAQNAALAQFSDPAQLRSIQSAASMSGVSWEVLAAIEQTESSRGGGTGPFGIDMAKAGGGISEADAQDMEKAGVFIGRKLAAASMGTVSSLPNPALDAGMVDTRGANGENVIKPSDLPEMVAVRDGVKTQYTAAISALPIAGNPEVAGSVFDAAQAITTGSAATCSPATVTLGGSTSAALSDEQKGYAQQIINATAAKGLPEQAAVIALSTALQESTLRMWWNADVPGSRDLTHDADAKGSVAGGQAYSVGLFQQQVHLNEFSWGTVNDAMDPAKSTGMFLDRLLTVNGWASMSVNDAAQAVQASGVPGAYAKWEAQARQLTADLKPTAGSYGTTTTASSSASPSASTGTASASSGSAASAATSSCLAGGVGTGVAGNGDDYPYKDGQIDVPDPWSELTRECVSFVAWRINVQMGWKPGQDYPFTPAKIGTTLFGSAVDWKDTVGSKFRMDNTPAVGAVAWWGANYASPSTSTGEAGHVAVVSAVKGDTVDIEEYNFGYNHAYNKRNVPVKDVEKFIHVADIKQ